MLVVRKKNGNLLKAFDSISVDAQKFREKCYILIQKGELASQKKARPSKKGVKGFTLESESPFSKGEWGRFELAFSPSTK